MSEAHKSGLNPLGGFEREPVRPGASASHCTILDKEQWLQLILNFWSWNALPVSIGRCFDLLHVPCLVNLMSRLSEAHPGIECDSQN